MTDHSSCRSLASTVTFGAVAVAAGLPAHQAAAQDVASALDGYTVTADGGLAFSDYSDQLFEDKGGSGPRFDRDKGFFGSVAISRKISDQWDWRVSGTLLAFQENTFREVFGGGDAGLGIDQQAKTFTADADFGHLIKAGNTDIRLGFGVLAGRHSQDLGFGIFTDGGDKGVDVDTDIDYRGFGLKVAADLAHPVSKDGRFKLIGGASIAPTSGTYTISGRARIIGGGPGGGGSEQTEEDGDAVFSSAYVGLSYQQSEKMDFRFGVRGDRFDSDSDLFGRSAFGGDVTSTTAFVGLRVQF